MKTQPTPLRIALERLALGAALCLALGLMLGGHASHAESSRKKTMTVSQVDEIPFKPSVDTYVVQQGDTLWSISRRIVGSAWLWPRVWSYNPEITNPNWIYPGDQIRFYPSDVDLPSLYDLASDERAIPEQPQQKMEEMPPAPRNGLDTSKFVGLFVTPKELAEAGTLHNSTDEHILLSRNDRVLLTFPKDSRPRSGERYIVYRTLGKVTHPITKKNVGYMTEVTGLASIEEVFEKMSKARIDDTRLEVERGQFVSRIDNDPRERVTPVPAATALEGYVLAVNADEGDIAGRYGVVFIDKGKNDGVQKGNQFIVSRSDDPILDKPIDLPPKPIATLMVVETKETASTCVVMQSKQEVEPGLKVKAVTR